MYTHLYFAINRQLPVEQNALLYIGISLIFLVLVYRCLHGLAPQYLSDYFQRVADTNRRRLRSSSSSFLAVRRTRLSTVGDRAFPVLGSRFWNTLPVSVTSAPSLAVFRSRLESYLFERSFPADSY